MPATPSSAKILGGTEAIEMAAGGPVRSMCCLHQVAAHGMTDRSRRFPHACDRRLDFTDVVAQGRRAA